RSRPYGLLSAGLGGLLSGVINVPARRRGQGHLGEQGDGDLYVARAAGSYLFDTRGKRYVDFVMGWCVGNFGWGDAELERRIERFRGPDYVYPDYRYRPWEELATLLVRLAPGDLTKCFRATGGSEAVELAIQAAMLHTKRHAFVSLEESYHGNTFGAMSVAGSEYREKFPRLLPNCRKIRPPLDEDALDRIETRLKRRDVAAFIMEPVSINLGVCVPQAGFMKGLRALCTRYRTLLILDEVACGFGRTGRIFATEHFDIEPDIICIAKAISGGVAGMGAMLATAAVGETMEAKGEFYSTYGWHPRSTDVAIASIRRIMRDKRKLLAQVAETSDYFRERIGEIEFRSKLTLNMLGLAIALHFEEDEYADALADRCRRNGLLVASQSGDVLLLPALNIDRRTASRGLDILEQSV
ncbi:MAG: argD, partial [Gemmatimonadetes bacterium]|nr:argD [Gemmatimonadota bacterium]